MSTSRRRPLKTVTGVGGAVSTYAAAIDPQQSTVASSIEIAKIAEANKFDALFAADLLRRSFPMAPEVRRSVVPCSSRPVSPRPAWNSGPDSRRWS